MMNTDKRDTDHSSGIRLTYWNSQKTYVKLKNLNESNCCLFRTLILNNINIIWNLFLYDIMKEFI